MPAPTTYVVKFPAVSTYTFGSTDETGISVESYEQNDQTDTFEQKNGVGEVIEVVTDQSGQGAVRGWCTWNIYL